MGASLYIFVIFVRVHIVCCWLCAHPLCEAARSSRSSLNLRRAMRLLWARSRRASAYLLTTTTRRPPPPLAGATSSCACARWAARGSGPSPTCSSLPSAHPGTFNPFALFPASAHSLRRAQAFPQFSKPLQGALAPAEDVVQQAQPLDLSRLVILEGQSNYIGQRTAWAENGAPSSPTSH